MASFDPNSYATVDERIGEFYSDFPSASVRTFIAHHADKEIVFEARIYRTPEEAEKGIYTSGFAREVEGAGNVNRTSHVENCETSAIGRALANLGYSGHVNGKKAPRPSREEMSKVERGVPSAIGSQSTGRTQPAPPQQNGSGKPWERPMPFGKTKGTALGDHTPEQLQKTLEWCNKDPERREKFADLIRDITTTIAAAEGASDDSY